jgi:peptidyl-prolyl cis-trans isomerase D
MIEDAIISHEAEKLGITVSDVDIDNELQSSFNFFPNGTPTPTLTPTGVSYPPMSLTQEALITPTSTATITLEPTVTATLEPTPTIAAPADATQTPTLEPSLTPTPYTLEGYQTNLDNYVTKLEEDQLSGDILRQSIAATLLRQKMLDYLTADSKPEEDQVWARHILTSDEATAIQARDRLTAGEDWNIVAAELSIDPGSQSTGGDLGWFGRGKTAAAFEEVAFALQPGEISQPVQSESGWHIIQVIGHEIRPLTQREFTALKESIFSQWLSDLVNSDRVERFDTWQTMIVLEPTIPPELLTNYQP